MILISASNAFISNVSIAKSGDREMEQPEIESAISISEGLDAWYLGCSKVFDEWFSLEKFQYHDGYGFYNGGRIICKCGKSYQWRDWNRMTAGASRMLKHLRREHGIRRGEGHPLAWPFLKKWMNEQEEFKDEESILLH